MTGVAQTHIQGRFAWQAWHLWHGVAPLGPVLSPVTPRLFAWQACHLVTSTFVLHGRCGTIFDTPSFTHHLCNTPSFTHHILHPTLSNTIFESLTHHVSQTALSHTPSFTIPPSTHHLSPHHFSHTTLSHTVFRHTIFHTPLCHRHNLSHTTLSHALFHTQLSHTHTASFTHCFVTHTHTPSFFVTHHLSHSTLSHTTVLTSRSFTASFPFPSFPVPATTFEAHYWKKLTCGVIRSFNFYNSVVWAAMMRSDQYQGVLQKQSGAAAGGIHNVPNTTT